MDTFTADLIAEEAAKPQLSQAELEAKETELQRRAEVLNSRDEAYGRKYRLFEATKEELCKAMLAFMVEHLDYKKPEIDVEGLLSEVEHALDDVDSAMSNVSSAESAAQEAYAEIDEVQSRLYSLQTALQKLED